MTISLKLGVGNLRSKLLANAMIFGQLGKPARAVPVLFLQPLLDPLYKLSILVQSDRHGRSPLTIILSSFLLYHISDSFSIRKRKFSYFLQVFSFFPSNLLFYVILLNCQSFLNNFTVIASFIFMLLLH